MRKVLLLIVFVVVEVFYSNIVKAQEEPACWSVTASVLNERSGPGTEYAITGTLSQGTVIYGTSNGQNWVQRDTGSWLAEWHLAQCESNTVSQPSSTETAANNPPTSSVENFGGITIVNRPTWLDGNDVVRLLSVVNQYVVLRYALACPNQPIVVYFGSNTEGQELAGQPIDALRGHYSLYGWNGIHLFRHYAGDCSQFVHGIFILQNMDSYTTWEVLGHEMGHYRQAFHGASSPSWVPNVIADATGLNDAYWIGYEVRKAAIGDCGASPSEFCIEVYNAVFAN